MTLNRMLFRLLPTLGALLIAGAAVAAPVSFAVNVSTVAGPGYLDFQFNPGFGAIPATATVSGFALSGGGSLLAPVNTVFPLPFQTPTATGDLESEVVIDNTDTFNAFLQRLMFGTDFSFIVTLSGPALNTGGNPGGTSFVLFQYDEQGAGGPLLELAIGADAEVTQSLAENVSIEAVPEPATGLVAGGSILLLMGVLGTRRLRSRTQSSVARP